MKVLLLFAFSIQSMGFPIACINTSYSRLEEVEITNYLGHLIIGAFAHHGPAFYEQEVRRCIAELAKNPNDFEARNDLGAAYSKLGNWAKALIAFQKNEQFHPGKYETASNLGVLYKKMEKYAEAEKYIKKALEIKPVGHMGLGDYYLQMIKWRKEYKTQSVSSDFGGDADISDNLVDQKSIFSPTGDQEVAFQTETEKANEVFEEENSDPADQSTSYDQHVTPEENFLGVPYDDGTAATAKIANKQYLLTLIKNDMNFSDAYLVLGDVLFEEKDYQMALRAYYRAMQLSNDQELNAHGAIARKRQLDIVKMWREERKPGYVVEQFHRSSQLAFEVEAASEWLKDFQQVEQEMIEQGRSVAFADLKPEVERRGIKKPRLLEAIYYKGTETDHGAFPSISEAAMILGVTFFIFIAVMFAIIGFLIYRGRSASKGIYYIPPAKEVV